MMESNVNEVEDKKDIVKFESNTETELSNFHNYVLQSPENTAVPSNKDYADLYKSIIFKFGKSYMCPACQKTFLYLYNLKRHVQNKHPPLLNTLFPLRKTKVPDFHNYIGQPSKKVEQTADKFNVDTLKSVFNSENNSYVCPECQQTSCDPSSFKRHIKTKHPCLFPILFPSLKSHKCDICDKSFKSSKTLQYHKNTIHKLHNGMTQHKCPLCLEMFTRMKFNDHFEKSHKLILKPIKINFGSYEEFCEWKKAIERVTKSYFAKHNSREANGIRRHGFICHRSGTYKSEAVMNKRKLKAQGSRKINGFCPATMKVTVAKEGTCQLVFQYQHIGHDNELQHLNLTLEEKKYVVQKLASNLPLNDILTDIHNSAVQDGAERLCLLKKKDLYNIKARLLKDKDLYLSAPKLDEKLTKDLRDIHNKHTESESISANITKIEKGWVITLTDYNEVYLIREISKSCNCTLICIYCRVCINSYICTCPDSSIQGNMCKHIHFFCMEKNKINDNHNGYLDLSSDSTENSCSSIQCIYPQENSNVLKSNELSKDKDNVTAIITSEKRNLLIEKFSDIIDSIKSEEEYRLSETTIQDLAVKLKSIQIHTVNNHDAVPANNNSIEAGVDSGNIGNHPYSNYLKNKAYSKIRQNSSEPSNRTLILEMRNIKQGAKICYINFAKSAKK